MSTVTIGRCHKVQCTDEELKTADQDVAKAAVQLYRLQSTGK